MKKHEHSDLDIPLIFFIAKNINHYLNQKLEKYHLERTQLHIFHYLLNNEGVSQNELGEALMLDKITITKKLQGLVEQEYVKKRTGAGDQRKKELYITEKGCQIHNELYEIVKRTSDILLQGFSPEEQKTIRELLGRMAQNIGQTDF